MQDSLIEITIKPELAYDRDEIRMALRSHGLSDIMGFSVVKRSIDARKRPTVFRLRCAIFPNERPLKETGFTLSANNVKNAPEIFIVGSGPCGLFAAIQLIEDGFKPIVLERGKDVRTRRRDLAVLNRGGVVNPESNYCFGEGGAGTYSDGKLYTRSKKRGSVEKILQYLVAFGAPSDILVDAHPHIGTNKLPQLIENMRRYILTAGGEVHFDSKLTDIETVGGKIFKIQLNGNTWQSCDKLILATGHSARDVFHLLHRRNIYIEAKPFALGVRVEHPQQIIDAIQYKTKDRGEFLPPASYSLVHQANGKGVYSFCMCPGGIIAPCATANGEIVTNGWSPSKRNNPFANAGIVVSVDASLYDPKNTGSPLNALEYQSAVEQAAWQLGGGKQTAPAQRMMDFTKGIISSDLPKCSYQPGLFSTQISDCLPADISVRLKEAFIAFGKKMPGYFCNEAVIVATESRTSSPVRIPRTDAFEHTEIKGLYPVGEGAGYAGGIVSAAIDGQKAAEALAISAKACT